MIASQSFSVRRRWLVCLGAVLGLCWIADRSAVLNAAEEPGSAPDIAAGETLYRKLCVACHGPLGEGVPDKHGTPLIGDKSVFELTALIDRTMPEGEPELCSAVESRNVAAFIHQSFYSPGAQARLHPPQIELSRLTVRQYRHAVADLIGTFRGSSGTSTGQGLQGEYFKSRRYRREDRVIERVDPVVSFDFGEGSPGEKIDPVEFGLKWQGSLLAPDSGEYRIVLRTENGARLWLNDPNKPLIDVWVRSGSDTEHAATITLLAGRAYPLRIEAFKSKEGKEKRASIHLEWSRPKRSPELVPARFLSPASGPEVFVVTAPFPPDDRSIGYERGTAVSKEWDVATTEAAIETAGYVVERLRELSGAGRDDGPDRLAKTKAFCTRFVERAFRRPLTDEVRQLFIERQFEGTDSAELAAKRVVLLTLKSPRFLFLDVDRDAVRAGSDDWQIAERLSFTLLDSLPDATLLREAAAGKLHTPEQVRQQAERLVTDPRARAKLNDFILQWLKVDQLPEVSKDSRLFPDFTPAIVADLRTSLELFLAEVLDSEAADFRQLLLADRVPLNGRLAGFYGAALPADAGFQLVSLNPELRAGVLTHPYLMSGFAYTASSSPIHRGVFISRSVLGRALRAPPEAVAPLAPDLAPHLTTRERTTLQTQADACQSCHNLINPLGFTLENFDAVGRVRQEEQKKPIDSTGSYITRTGQSQQFNGVRALATFLADSPESHQAFVEQLFHSLVKQPIRAFGPETPEALRQRFQEDQFNVRKLMVEIAVRSAAGPALTPEVR